MMKCKIKSDVIVVILAVVSGTIFLQSSIFLSWRFSEKLVCKSYFRWIGVSCYYLSMVLLPLLHTFGVCTVGGRGEQKENVFNLKTICTKTHRGHFAVLWLFMPNVEIKWVISMDFAVPKTGRHANCYLLILRECSFRRIQKRISRSFVQIQIRTFQVQYNIHILTICR